MSTIIEHIEKNFEILDKKNDIHKTMTIKCLKCGHIVTLTLGNGKWKKYVCQNCSTPIAKFKEAFKNKNYHIEDIKTIQAKLQTIIIESDFGRKKNLVTPTTYNNINFLASVIELTSYIPVENNFRWPERFYLIHHNLYNNPPEATNAKGELPYFINFVKGYQSTKAVPKDKIKEEYSKMIKEKLSSSGFDVISVFQNKHKQYCAEIKCYKCGIQYTANLTAARWKNFKCFHCAENIIKSTGEEEIINYLKSIYDGEIIIRSRDIISPQEIDIYIPKLKLAIEFNGLFWHTEENGKDKNYHINKTNLCAEKGIQLIHILEDEWNDKQQIVKARLKHLIKRTPYKIFARKCVIKEIDNFTAAKFINKYHLQGNSAASVRLGLFYKNRLVSVMTFCKSRFNKKYDWELARFASVFNFSIIGGASKLLTYFRKHYHGSIISYADKRWSTGNLYRQLGFKELQDSSPGYFYTKGNKRYSRIKFQKHKLKDVLKNFDPSISETENMRNNNYHRIWDCGNKVFEI